MNRLSAEKVVGLALVLVLAVIAASMIFPAQVMAAPLNQCSSATIQYGDMPAQYQLTLVDKAASESTRDFVFVAGDFKPTPLYYEHHRCERVRHHCHNRCDDSNNPHRCFRHCMRERDCD